MGAFTRRKLAAITQHLVDNASHFEFFQAIHVLEENWHGHGEIGNGLDKWVRMRPASEISFPAADIRRCVFKKNGTLDLELNFMGLYGVDAPVPNYFVELVARNDESSMAMREFLDIFCHRLYAQYYQAWKKYRPHLHLEKENSPFLDYLKSLSGNVIMDTDPCSTEYSYCAALGSRVHGAAGLGGILSDWLEGIPVTIREFVPRWVRVERDHALGVDDNSYIVGDTMFLGDEILDVSGKIEIHIGPVTVEEAKNLLPGKNAVKGVGNLVRQYLEPIIDFDLVILVKPSKGVSAALGKDAMVLGWSCWLGEKLSDSYEIHIPGKSILSESEETEQMPTNNEFAMVA